MQVDTLQFSESMLDYFSIDKIIKDDSHKFFRKIKHGNFSEIPYFLRVIYDHDRDTALKLLDYVERNLDNEEVFADCLSQFAVSCFEQEDYLQAGRYGKQVIPLFKSLEKTTSLGYTYFLLTKSALASNAIELAGKFAHQALAYAQTAEEKILQEEIESFIVENSL
ncbi:hypothetical protein GMJAKD_07030 [Candidatus Electrothrix aarhusensis]